MVAVISSTELPFKDTAYLISYFGEKEPSDYELHQPWARETMEVRNEDREIETWGAVEDVWDFGLQSWIKKRQLQWIMPGDEELLLKDFGKCLMSDCPERVIRRS